MGGLGNQMFQFATAFVLSQKYQVPLKIDTLFLLDRTLVDKVTPRNFELDCFNLDTIVATKEEVEKFSSKKTLFERVIYKILLINNPQYFIDKEIGYDFQFEYLKSEVYLDGYWQTEKYFQNIRVNILELFQWRLPLDQENIYIYEQINSEEAVSVHIRRGDYLTNQKNTLFHGICEMEYYEKAIQLIIQKTHNPVFYFFSDDIQWVKKSFNELTYKSVFISHNTEKNYNDLRLMSYCKHNIIANSTFSWWGAWLNKNENKIVIAPKKWFADQNKNNKSKDLLPKNWIKL